MNVALLEDIKAHILVHPEQLDMDTWACETAYCIAGLALHLRGLKIANPQAAPALQRLDDGRYPDDAAAGLLGLESDRTDRKGYGSLSADRLFQIDLWPDDLLERWEDTTQDWCVNPLADRAQIAAERIDGFVASGGAE